LQEAVAPAAEVPELREDEAGFPAARAGGGRCQGGTDSEGMAGSMETPWGMVGRAGGVCEERNAKTVKEATGAPGQRTDKANVRQ